jgi:hypothetical protein
MMLKIEDNAHTRTAPPEKTKESEMTIKKPTREEWLKWLMDTPVIPENIPEHHTGDVIKLFDPKTDTAVFVPPKTLKLIDEEEQK